MKFSFVHAEKAHFPIAFMCKRLEVSRAGYYAWAKRPESKRSKANRQFVTQIVAIHGESRQPHGSPRVHAELVARGQRVCRHRVARLTRAEELRSKRNKRFVRTTDCAHLHPVAPNTLDRNFWPEAPNEAWAGDITYLPNTLDRNFWPEAPNEAWAGDITYIPTREGWLFLAVVLDLFSRRVVGWAMGPKIDRQLALDALLMAIVGRPILGEVLHHTDARRRCSRASGSGPRWWR